MGYLLPASGVARQARISTTDPVAGTDEVQTLTIGGTPTGGTFKLSYRGQITSAITWTATDATLVTAIDTALGALSTIGGAGNVTVADTTLTSGIGAVSITFVGNLAKLNVALIEVAVNDLVGTAPTLAVTVATPGVTATHRGAPTGALLQQTTSGVWYSNTGTVYAPTWTAIDVASVSQEMIDLAAALPTVAVADIAGTAPTISAADAVAVAGLAPTISAANASAVAGTTPAGGTGATEGAYDTAVNRDAFIATVAEMKVSVNALVTEATELKADVNTNAATLAEAKVTINALVTEATELKADHNTTATTVAELATQLNALLAALRTAGIVTP